MYEILAKYYDDLMGDFDYDAYEKFALENLKDVWGGFGYDLASGSGEMAIRLKRNGFKVVGGDVSPEMLEKATEKARKARLDVPFVFSDLNDLHLEKKCDFVTAVCDGFNYVKGNIMPYLITATNVNTGKSKGVLNGKTEIVKQENWDGWEITEIVSDYTESSFASWEIVNYIFMFDPERGYLVRVSGTDSMETLEEIAENLEIRESDTPPYEYPFSEEIGYLDLGRG